MSNATAQGTNVGNDVRPFPSFSLLARRARRARNSLEHGQRGPHVLGGGCSAAPRAALGFFVGRASGEAGGFGLLGAGLSPRVAELGRLRGAVARSGNAVLFRNGRLTKLLERRVCSSRGAGVRARKCGPACHHLAQARRQRGAHPHASRFDPLTQPLDLGRFGHVRGPAAVAVATHLASAGCSTCAPSRELQRCQEVGGGLKPPAGSPDKTTG